MTLFQSNYERLEIFSPRKKRCFWLSWKHSERLKKCCLWWAEKLSKSEKESNINQKYFKRILGTLFWVTFMEIILNRKSFCDKKIKFWQKKETKSLLNWPLYFKFYLESVSFTVDNPPLLLRLWKNERGAYKEFSPVRSAGKTREFVVKLTNVSVISELFSKSEIWSYLGKAFWEKSPSSFRECTQCIRGIRVTCPPPFRRFFKKIRGRQLTHFLFPYRKKKRFFV